MTGSNHQPIVIKLGGRVLDDAPACASIAASIAASDAPVVVVHGGGDRVDTLLDKLNITTPKIDGIRATSKEAIGPVVGVLAGLVNKSLVGVLRSHGCDAVGLCLGDGGALEVEQVANPALAMVGRVVSGEADLWRELLGSGYTPVVSSIGLDVQGQLLNVNADDAALGAARALGARTLVMVTDTQGVLDTQQTLIPELDAATARALIADGTIAAGMIPKVTAALLAAESLAAPVHIAHWSALTDIMQDSTTGPLAGTRILPESLSRVRPRGGPELATTESA